jgi:hypothetical protein
MDDPNRQEINFNCKRLDGGGGALCFVTKGMTYKMLILYLAFKFKPTVTSTTLKPGHSNNQNFFYILHRRPFLSHKGAIFCQKSTYISEKN